jgi:D-glycero-alpha-D-manno-heptose 1-phosphate guanylyltransferase
MRTSGIGNVWTSKTSNMKQQLRLPDKTCILLVGGMGTRLRSVLPDLPKCLAPVGTKTFLELQIAELSRQGIQAFVLSVGYMAHKIIHIVEQLSVNYRIYTVEELQPLGTGGAILNAMNSMELNEVLVANGDTYLDGDIKVMYEPLKIHLGEYMRVATINISDRSRYGGIKISSTDSRIIVENFYEKGMQGPGLINAGLYRINRVAFNETKDDKVFSLENKLMPLLAGEGHLGASIIDGNFIDIGVPNDYYHLCNKFI